MTAWMKAEVCLFQGFSISEVHAMAEWVVFNEMWPKARADVLLELEKKRLAGAQIVVVSGVYQPIVDAFARKMDAADRDKSDAARSIIELVAIFAGDVTAEKNVQQLRNSRYKHFRDQANVWQGRTALLVQLNERISAARHDGRFLVEFSIVELERLATELAVAWIAQSRKTSISRKLGDATRVIWSKQSLIAAGLVKDGFALEDASAGSIQP